MARQRTKRKGVFCIETDWWGDLRRQSSVRPVLELLRQDGGAQVPYVHRDVATRAEFDHYIKKWTLKKFDDYPILYIATHGVVGGINFGDDRKNENLVHIDELENLLVEKCARRVIYFGSCETLVLHGRRLNRFVRNTGALAICGYTTEVDWMESAAFDLLFLDAAQHFTFTKQGAAAIKRRMDLLARGFAKGLNHDDFKFRMVTGRP